MEKFTIPIFVVFLLIVLILLSIIPVNGGYSYEGFNYSYALNDSLSFFDANRCGSDVESNNKYKWRVNCHETDGSDIGMDLTGGFHDDGDFNKTGILQSYSASIIGWSYYEYGDVFINTGNDEKVLDTLKRFTDYFIKCNQENGSYICDVTSKEDSANQDSEKKVWIDDSSDSRNREITRKADNENPASEVLGLTASSLYLMSKNYRSKDSEYADKCWDTAEELFTMAKQNEGLIYKDGPYKTTSYYDDLAWAATCKYLAEPDEATINEADSYIKKAIQEGINFEDKRVMYWDDVYLPAILLISDIKKDDKYKNIIKSNISFWKDGMDKTKGGLRYYTDKGVLSYSASSSYLALVYSKYYKEKDFEEYAKGQIDYILGNNPNKISYMIGFGLDWSKHPRHILANTYTATNNDYKKEAKNLLKGGLVSGPDKDDKFNDDVDKDKYTGVEIDYNANFIASLSAIENLTKEEEGEEEKKSEVNKVDIPVLNDNQEKKSQEIKLSVDDKSTEVDKNTYEKPSDKNPIILKIDINSESDIGEMDLIINNKVIDSIKSEVNTYNWVPLQNAEGIYYIILKARKQNGEEVNSNQIKVIVKF
ncbi:MAG: glycoside hydrolase family 9 protein [Clostridiales bacterium]